MIVDRQERSATLQCRRRLGPPEHLTRWPATRARAVGRARRTIWTLTLDTGALTQVTYLDDSFSSRWMPDGKHIVFAHFPIDRASRHEPVERPHGRARKRRAHPRAVGCLPECGLVRRPHVYCYAYRSNQARPNMVSVSTGDTAASIRAARNLWSESCVPFPDGRWLAYQTNASGRAEARLAPFTDLTAFAQVSIRGGSPIRWSRDGSRLFYTDGDDITAVDIGPGGPVLTSRRAVFSVPRDWRGRLDVMPDGEHAVMIRGGLIYSDIIVMQGALTGGRGR